MLKPIKRLFPLVALALCVVAGSVTASFAKGQKAEPLTPNKREASLYYNLGVDYSSQPVLPGTAICVVVHEKGDRVSRAAVMRSADGNIAYGTERVDFSQKDPRNSAFRTTLVFAGKEFMVFSGGKRVRDPNTIAAAAQWGLALEEDCSRAGASAKTPKKIVIDVPANTRRVQPLSGANYN